MRRLSTVTGTPYRTLQNYLGGTHPMPAPTLARIADALEVSADWLLFARPATFDRDCLKRALDMLDAQRNALQRFDSGASLGALAIIFDGVYSDLYSDRHGSSADSKTAKPGATRRRRGR
jgi:hypothetical protein